MLGLTLLYIDPGTGGAIFQGLSAVLAAAAGGAAVCLACLLRPVRAAVRRVVRALGGARRPGGE